MQKLCAVAGGVKAYVADPGMLVSPETRRCPLCRDGHRLRLHDWYSRYVLLPDPEPAVRVPVRRLLCAAKGRTVSLLPDFCLPRRQHGPAILGAFLVAWALQSQPLVRALKTVRDHVAGHSVAQSLLRGFLARLHALRTYLAALRPQPVDVPEEVPRPRRDAAAILLGLLDGFRDAAAALVHHGRAFHARFAQGLA